MEIYELVQKLNKYRDAYYNYNQSLVSDKEYDDLFDQLVKLEAETGIILANSPTQTVGYTVQDKLNKVKHTHPMLSLDKTKDVADILKFADNQSIIAMCKMDGLTCSLHYDKSGYLVSAETRGNGEIGEDILENAKQISNIPLKINNKGIPLTVDGEVIVDYDTFNAINENLDDKYSHPRNLASGSIRQLDTRITHDRKLKFIPWKVVEGIKTDNFADRLFTIGHDLGFEIVPFQLLLADYVDIATLEVTIELLKQTAREHKYPIDGIVFTYNKIAFGESLGSTGHHPRHSLAYKFYDDTYETTLRDIEWNPTRTGILAPIAIFDPVDLDGAITSRASLSNVSIIKELELGIGDIITVYRANQVIPHIDDNLTRSNSYCLPTKCPCCGSTVELRKEGIAEMLYCTNPSCESKVLAKFIHFTSKQGMNIDGLSEATLNTFLKLNYITDFKSIYHLDRYENQIKNLDGFGIKSYNKLLSSIDKSRTISLDKFLVALGINQIGSKAAKMLSDFVDGSWTTLKYKIITKTDFTALKDFGPAANSAIYEYFTDSKIKEIDTLVEELTFELPVVKEIATDSFITGKTFVITGALAKPRKYYEDLIIQHGGKLSGSVSKSTDFLLTNDPESGSSKNKKAKELGIPIISEENFLIKLK